MKSAATWGLLRARWRSSKSYEPGEVEAGWYRRWLEEGCFRADATSGKPGYSIVPPPPNVTRILHIGHGLNNRLQDIQCRRTRQEGKKVFWLPGTDHAKSATQTRMEQKLRAEGTSRREVGRARFLEMVWEWKEHHGGIIIDQLKRLGCSCDWKRERFTMEESESQTPTQIADEIEAAFPEAPGAIVPVVCAPRD